MVDYHDLQMPGSWPKLLSGHFVCNGSSNPVTASGLGYSVARDDTGDYTVTLTDKYGHLVAVHPTTQYAGPAGTGTVDVELTEFNHNASSFSVTTTSGGSAFDFGDDVSVHWILTARKTQVNP